MAGVSATSITGEEGKLFVPSHIDFTAPLPPYRAIESSMIQEERPVGGCDNAGPYLFTIAKDPGRYIQTSFMKIGGKMRIVKKDGSNMDAAAHVAPIEFFGQAWIKKIEIIANKTLISTGSEVNYHTKALINTLLNYDNTATETHLRCSGFAPEEKPIEDDSTEKTKWNDAKNWKSLRANREKFSLSKWVEFSSDLQVDMLRTNRDLPNNVELSIKIYRHEAEYLLMRGTSATNTWDETEYEIQLDDLILSVRKIQPTLEILNKNNMLMEKQPALFQFDKWDMARDNLPKDRKMFYTHNLFNYVPGTVVYCLVDSDGYNSAKKFNPNHFKHWNIKKFVQFIGGVPAPVKYLEFDWENDNVSEAYRQLYDGCGISTLNRSNLITYNMYKKTRFLIVMNNQAEGLTFDGARARPQSASVTCTIEFHEKLPKNLEFLAFGISGDVLAVDANRDFFIKTMQSM